ncbi:MAG: hypothetical protein AB4206_13775 [Xenococcaceae cyanobacterium]
MQNKQKVTLYIPPELHRRLKIRAAIDVDSMSSLVEKAIAFYLQYPDKVEEIESSTQGNTHQVHLCPECEAPMVMRKGKMISLMDQPGAIAEDLPLEVRGNVKASDLSQGEELVPCLK